jgi:hypothetical protein
MKEVNGMSGRTVKSATDNNTIARLREMAMRGLPRMYLPDERLYAFCLRKTRAGVVSEGVSRRYTAITLIGLAAEEQSAARAATGGLSLLQVCDRLNQDIEHVNNLGDVALTLWAARAVGYPDRSRMWKRLVALQPVERVHPVVEISWALDAACIDPDAAEARGLREGLARRLLGSFSNNSRVFPHVLGASGARAHISCFADMVYPIHALSNYARLTGERQALDAATAAAGKICELQGEKGQWWWHYDQRSGKVIEGYPVYAIHQDAMAPMALFALKDAGGPDYSAAIQKGLDWLAYSPEIQGSLIDKDADLIWRKVARREPGKLSRYAQAAASRVHPSLRIPGLNRLFPATAIDYEDRPYHLGWLLYAWPSARAEGWDHTGGVA